MYLDVKGVRAARSGKKLSWTDLNDNKHDLDFVFERGGTADTLGTPVAFIETAWRRYTKHSRNKAQEIQGAILPLFEKYKSYFPFKGVILAGVFTEGAISQLKSLGFCVLYFSYGTVVKAFEKFGIDARFDENTPEKDFRKKIDAWQKLDKKQIRVAKELLQLNEKEVVEFLLSLSKTVSRHITRVTILSLHGNESQVNTIVDAINWLKVYAEVNASHPFVKYEIIISYNNGDKIQANFIHKEDAIEFLESYR